jgi:signal peptidase I
MAASLSGIGAMTAVIALAVVVAVLRRRIAVVAVIGSSMQPTLNAGDRVLVRRATIGDLRMGQIAVFERPDNERTWGTTPPRWPADRREWMIKRVAAVPGDRLPAGMLALCITAEPAVPAGHVVVLGDNAASSLDSRQLGYIPAERLLGVVLRPLARR